MIPRTENPVRAGVMTRGLSSSLRQDWATPQTLFRLLGAEFHFTIDACAVKETACCADFFRENSLVRAWRGTVWCNPPYGKFLKLWVYKACCEANLGSTVVMLLPARTDTSWWHDYVIPSASEIRYLRGRLRFDDTNGRAPFPSVIVVFRPISQQVSDRVDLRSSELSTEGPRSNTPARPSGAECGGAR